jgi:Uncharacterized protein conserved in bacteria (DUF2188)
MSKRPLHVKPDGDVWVVQKEGSTRASAVVDTKREALEVAADIARNQNLTVVVHGSNGRIQRRYQPGDGPSDEGCFVTTACVRHHGLADDCYELTTLRYFRDTHMISSPAGVALVRHYYMRAPLLVKRLNKRGDKDTVYREVLHRVRFACAAIERRQFSVAQSIYIDALRWLESLVD